MSSIFSKVISGELPSYTILEDDDHLAFLDINPLARGHVLVIPKKQTDYIFDINTLEYLALWKFTKKVAQAINKSFKCKRVGIAVIGLEVPHTHIHLVPINSLEDLDFSRPKLKLSNIDFEKDMNLIKSII